MEHSTQTALYRINIHIFNGKTYEKPKLSVVQSDGLKSIAKQCIASSQKMDVFFLFLLVLYNSLAVRKVKGRDDYKVCFERIYFCYDFHNNGINKL